MIKEEVMLNLRTSENMNYFKTNLYIIISSNTLERYLATMDKLRESPYLELFEYELIMFDYIFSTSKVSSFSNVASYFPTIQI